MSCHAGKHEKQQQRYDSSNFERCTRPRFLLVPVRDTPPTCVWLKKKVLATDLKQHFDVLGEFNSHLADVQDGVLVDEGRSKTYTCAMKVISTNNNAARPPHLTLVGVATMQGVDSPFLARKTGGTRRDE